MIYIVHGDDYPKSRRLIINQQKKISSNIKIERDLSNLTPKELYEAACSFDLFGNPPLLVVTLPPGKVAEIKDYLKILKKIPKKTTVILLSEKKLGKTNRFIRSAPELKAKVIFNQKPSISNVFKFLDNLYIQNRKGTYKELESLIEENAEAFFILSMILYGLRNLVHAKFLTGEFLAKSDFVKSKILKQAENFTREEVIGLFDFIYNTDKKIKTGQIQPDIALTHTIEKILSL